MYDPIVGPASEEKKLGKRTVLGQLKKLVIFGDRIIFVFRG